MHHLALRATYYDFCRLSTHTFHLHIKLNMSFMKIINNNGPSIDPCGIPPMLGTIIYYISLYITYYSMCDYYCLSHQSMFYWTIICSID